MVGNDKKVILEQAFLVLDGDAETGQIPEKWDGKAAERIVQILLETFKV